MEELDPREMYVSTSDLLAAGFTNTDDYMKFMRMSGIEKTIKGWPILKTMRALNLARKGKLMENNLKDQLTQVKIDKEKISNAIKLKEYIERELAVDRMRVSLQATAQKIRYAIKISAPAVIGIQNVQDVENILTEQYNLAMEQLLAQADSLENWETYGYKIESNIQSGGVTVAENTQESTSSGSSEEDKSVNSDQCDGADRSGPDTLHKGTNQFNWKL